MSLNSLHSAEQPVKPTPRLLGWLEHFFRLGEHGSTWGRELVGGTTTFLAMSYIIFVQPGVLSQAGMDFQAVLYATCLGSALATLLMGLWAKYPVALAPGMGENFFFTFTLCAAAPLGFGLSWQQALTAVFLSGVLFMFFSLFGMRGRIISAIPDALKTGIAAGIGLFITLIGLEYGNLVAAHPSTLIRLGDVRSPVAWVALAGLLTTMVLLAYRVRGAILLGILVSSGLAWGLGLVHYQGVISTDIRLAPTLLRFDFAGFFQMSWPSVAAIIFVLFLLVVFDSVGTLVGVSQQAGLMREGKLPRAERALFSGAVGTTAGAALGTSTIVCYIESATGVSDGARTGLANLVTGGWLLLAMLFSPLAAMVGGGVVVGSDPSGNPILRYPTLAPALIVVGSMMLRIISRIPWDDPTEALPAFLTLVGIPFSFSIAAGIAIGFISYAAIKLLSGRSRECPLLIYLFAALFVVQLLLT